MVDFARASKERANTLMIEKRKMVPFHTLRLFIEFIPLSFLIVNTA
jgi:hypothetical protein